jgi:membrane-associated protein
MDFLNQVLTLILHPHVDQLREVVGWMTAQGALPWFYFVLFLIVFCETGLVVTPFLPGDSLLFGLGAVATLTGGLISLPLVIVLLIVAAVLGDAVNYSLGLRAGPKIFSSDKSRLFNKKHLLRAQDFYEKYGGKAIILARFVPIVRTFAPFVAGIGQMRYRRFALYNVVGAVVWVSLFAVGGALLARLPIVEKNLHVVTAAIILLSVAPIVVEFVLARRRKALAGRQAQTPC